MAKKKQQTQSDEYQSEDQNFMERRLEMIAKASKRLFCPDLEEDDELHFD